jgi:hypothetical protein
MESAARAQRKEGYKNVIDSKTNKKPIRTPAADITYLVVKGIDSRSISVLLKRPLHKQVLFSRKPGTQFVTPLAAEWPKEPILIFSLPA